MTSCAVSRPSRWAAGLLGLLALGGCSLFCSEEPPPVYFPVCVTLKSTPRLNWFRGGAHTVFARVVALSSVEAFEAAQLSVLLADHPPFLPGMVGAPKQADIHPGTETTFNLDAVAGQTFGSVGVAAGYYQPLGKSKLVVTTKDTTTGTCFVINLGEAGVDEQVTTVTPTPTPED
jgi:type VI secretion system VasD/TssJ family lipoprotein